MKAQIFKDKSEAELQKILLEKRERLRQLYFELSQGKLKNNRQIRKVKREIARILTTINLKSKSKV